MSRPHYLYGFHVIGAVLERAPERVLSIGYDVARRDARMAAVLARARSVGIGLEGHNQRTLDERAGSRVHQGIIALARPAETLDQDGLVSLVGRLDHSPLLLALDGIVDPHNLGACMRTAEALGVDAVIIPRHKAVGLNATVCKVACGAADILPVAQVANLKRCLSDLKQAGCWVYGACMQADQAVSGVDLDGPAVFVLGGEGAGLRHGTRGVCDQMVAIPMSGATASLNVSVAAGILIYEAVRQRQAVRGHSAQGGGELG